MDDFKSCCFSGHRYISAEHFMKLPELLDQTLERLVNDGFRHFKTGGAIGFDTLCALKCLDLKKRHPSLSITLELCLPCRDQTLGWTDHDKAAYNFVLSRADKVFFEYEKYTSGCMYKRNRRLVDGSDVCVTYLASSSGGTAYTCNYARSKGVRIINLRNML